MASSDKIRKYINFCTQYKPGTVSYCIEGKPVGDTWGKIILLFNGNTTDNKIPLPEGNYQIIANGNEIDENGLGEISDEALVKGISFMLLKSSQQ
jgi:pullulanase